MDTYSLVAAALNGQTSRIWQGDIECVYEPLRPYGRMLERLAAMAGPLFAPRQISESWRFDQAWLICLRYVLDDQPLEIWIRRSSDYLDLRFLIQVNRWLQGSGYQFEVVDDCQDTLIVLASGGEKALIEQALGRECRRFGDADRIGFFMAAAEHRLRAQDYAGLIGEATALLDDGAAAAEIYDLRGRAYYESGQPDLAWLDWAAAAQTDGAVYARIAARYGHSTDHSP